jgi:hypothetical protein
MGVLKLALNSCWDAATNYRLTVEQQWQQPRYCGCAACSRGASKLVLYTCTPQTQRQRVICLCAWALVVAGIVAVFVWGFPK